MAKDIRKTNNKPKSGRNTAKAAYGNNAQIKRNATAKRAASGRKTSTSYTGYTEGRKVISINELKKRRLGMTNRRSSASIKPVGNIKRVDTRSGRFSGYSERGADRRLSGSAARYPNASYVEKRAVTTGPSRPSSGKARSNNKKNADRYVHKKVQGIGYEGAAQIFMMFILILAVLYIGGNILRYALKTAVSYDTVQIGSIDTPKSAEGLIIRSEKVYKTDIDGDISYRVPDGQKVSAGELICTIKASDVVDEAEKTIDDMNEEAVKKEQIKTEIDPSNESAKKINLEIKALSDDAAMSFAASDPQALRDFYNNASVKQEMRNQAVIGADTSTDIKGERQRAENVIAENSVNVSAAEGGIMCLETDGFENELTPDNMSELKEKDIQRSNDGSHVAGEKVEAGENIFKILTSNVWYIASYIDSEYISDWAKGDRRTIYVTNSMGEKTDMDVVIESLEPGNKKCFVIMRASKYIIDNMYLRNLTFEIDKVKTGYKIANSSIVENTLIKIPAAYVVDGAVTKQNGTKVSVGEISGDYAYFPVGYDTLVLHDVILNPDDQSDAYELSEVETRSGVYIMNTGIAQFYTIDLTDSVSNSTHTILSPEKNRNISVYDRVVVDPKNIQDNDMLYK